MFCSLQMYAQKKSYMRYALSVSAGYDYRLTEWMAIGINYTGYQIGHSFDFEHSCNISDDTAKRIDYALVLPETLCKWKRWNSFSEHLSIYTIFL